jgi:surfeit locus 1 family protein
MVLAVVATLLLGRWQYDVWQQHRADSAAAVTRLSPVPLDDVLGRNAAFPAAGLARPVVVEGTWVPAQTVFVSGRQQAGRTGYWVVTSVLMPSGSEIPVVRGWVPDLSRVPVAPHGRAVLVGLLQPSEDSGTSDGPVHGDIYRQLSIASLLQRTHRDLYGGYVVATDRPVHQTTPETGMTGLAPATATQLPGADAATAVRNLLYAFQWWVFGAFAIFMWWRWLQEDVLGRGGGRSPTPR